MSDGAVAAGLIAASLLAFVINLYFISLMTASFPAPLKRLLGVAAHACNVEGGVCEIVVQTPYARMFGGVPNVFVGLAWNAWVIASAITLLATGELPLIWLSWFVAASSLVVAAYLIYALLFVLKKPCPL